MRVRYHLGFDKNFAVHWANVTSDVRGAAAFAADFIIIVIVSIDFGASSRYISEHFRFYRSSVLVLCHHVSCSNWVLTHSTFYECVDGSLLPLKFLLQAQTQFCISSTFFDSFETFIQSPSYGSFR